MKFAAIGDNCIDLYDDRFYATGNAVDTGVNVRQLGIPTAIISTTGDDDYGRIMIEALKKQDIDLSRFQVGKGPTAVTKMTLNGLDRVHLKYDEGVLADLVFSPEDVEFAGNCEYVHSGLWGKAENVLGQIRDRGSFVSFDYADRLEHPLVESTLRAVDLGFYSYHGKEDDFIRDFLADKCNRGMKYAVATFGENGSIAYDGQNFHRMGICQAKTVNTVGAGDSYIAGFLVGLMQGKDIEECMKLGAQVAAKVVAVFEPWVGY